MRTGFLYLRSGRLVSGITSGYFVPEDDFRCHLTVAARDGIDVRILHPGCNTDKQATWYAARYHYEELLGAGVRIYEYQPTMIHVKTITIDGLWASVGSINFHNRSMMLNDEVTLLIRDSRVAEELESVFLEDLDHSARVDLDEFRRRSRIARTKEQLANLVSNVL